MAGCSCNGEKSGGLGARRNRRRRKSREMEVIPRQISRLKSLILQAARETRELAEEWPMCFLPIGKIAIQWLLEARDGLQESDGPALI